MINHLLRNKIKKRFDRNRKYKASLKTFTTSNITNQIKDKRKKKSPFICFLMKPKEMKNDR